MSRGEMGTGMLRSAMANKPGVNLSRRVLAQHQWSLDFTSRMNIQNNLLPRHTFRGSDQALCLTQNNRMSQRSMGKKLRISRMTTGGAARWIFPEKASLRRNRTERLHVSRPDYVEGGMAHLELCLQRLTYMFKDSQHLEWMQWRGSVKSLCP